MLTCVSLHDFSGNINNILLFGLVHKVKPYTTKTEGKVIASGLQYYCTTTDKQGNQYKLFSDTDPCLKIASTIALKI